MVKDRIELQTDEFSAADELARQIKRIRQTAVVDDDWPWVKHDYDRAADAFARAALANGRNTNGRLDNG